MGAGNLTYRQNLWGGGASSYLSRASALQLASHPLFTGSDRGRWDDAESAFKSLEFSATNGTLKIQGVVTGAIPPYAVIAYVWPAGKRSDDHWSRTFLCVLKDGAFTLDVDGLREDVWHRKMAGLPKENGDALARQFRDADDWHLVLRRLHVNGSTAAQEFHLHFDASSGPDVAALNTAWYVEPAENAVMRRQPEARNLVSDEAVAAAPTPEAARELRLLRTVLEPPAPFDLASVRENSAFLSDAKWTDAKVGWGKLARNYF
jgi:hypothetical protein